MNEVARHSADVPVFLDGGGEMGALMRAHDWSASPLGHPSSWPQSLRSVAGLLLSSKFPMFVAWGSELGFLYNDAYSEILSAKHPQALGARFRDIWSEIWPDISPLVDAALAGKAIYSENLPLVLNRKGFDEQAWFTFSYSPVRDESGQVSGMYCAVAETTTSVLAERRLTAERERLAGLFEQAPSFMAMMQGPEHVFELVNAAYLQLIGHRDVIGKAAREALPEIKGQGFFELLDKVYASGEPFVGRSLPADLQRTSGAPTERRFVDFVFQPVKDAAGAVTGIFVEGSDVTERVLAEAELRASEEFNRRILASSADCIKVLDLDARLQFMSEGGMCVMEVDDFGTIEGQCWPDFWQGDGHAKALAAVEEAKRGSTGRFQGFATTLKGSPRWWDVIVTPIAGPDGQPEKLLSISRDVTTTKQAETALRELNDTLEQRVMERTTALAQRTAERDQLWSLSEDLLARADYEGMMSAVSPAWTRVLGWSEAELLAQPYSTFMHPEDMKVTLAALARMGETGQPTRFENRIATSDGSWKPIEWIVAPEPDSANFIAVGRDLSEAKAREEELRQAQEALRQSQKMEAVGQLTGGLAHDFNNLLAGISGSLELMATRITQGRLGDVERYMVAAQGAARRAAALTHRLLAFSRRQTLAPKVTDVNSLVAGMEELIRRTVGPAVVVESVTGTGVWAVEIDPNQLENALLNLAINARDAMPNGGRLTIETANRWMDARAAREQELSPGQYVSLSVSDTGSGMAPEVVARAFDPFFTTKPIGVGTGLGLSMVYGFARQSGGQVRIYSEVGKGTRVSLYLPRHLGSAEEQKAHRETKAAVPTGAGETVLVIDDEPVVRMLIADVLEELGYAALEASDGPEGLKVLQSRARVDLLVTDVGLPGGLNGRQVADAARELRPELKVLFITGYAENAVLNHGHLDHGMHVVTKPFAVEELARRIKAILSEG